MNESKFMENIEVYPTICTELSLREITSQYWSVAVQEIAHPTSDTSE
jgi:hypothetical protein